MHPEQPRRQEEPGSAPQAGLCTGLLRCLQLAARPFSLPGVHAAGSPAEEPPFPSPSLPPSSVGRPEFPDTGWDRLRDLFTRRERQAWPEEVSSVVKSGLAAGLVAWFYGGPPAARHARERFIQLSQARVYESQVEAVRSAHGAAIRGFVRYGWRWSWRVAAFVTLYNTVGTCLSVYRGEYTFSNYAAAGAVTGGVFRLNLGLAGLMSGSLIGAALGVPVGALIVAMRSLSEETFLEKRRRERRELYELQLAEWSARLQLTDDLIADLSGPAGGQEAQRDLQKVQELLSQPRNASAPAPTNHTGQNTEPQPN